MIIIDPANDKMVCMPSSNALGNGSSIVLQQQKEKNFNLFINVICIQIYPMSLEKRFKIRPDGFVSKKRILVDTIALNIDSYRFCDARMHTS